MSKNNSSEGREAKVLLREALERMLKEIHSPADPQEVWRRVSAEAAGRKLIKNWSAWTPRQRRRGWEEAAARIEAAAYATRPYCLRCGTCCRKGSPSLLREDLPLLQRGVIPRTDLVTLRSGEAAYANEKNAVIRLRAEQVKIREKPGTRECLYFREAIQTCGIYDDRPAQCRVLECWNPAGFRALKKSPFLTRGDLLNTEDPLRAVLIRHEQRCGLGDLEKALEQAAEAQAGAEDVLRDLLGFDRHVRETLGKQFGMERSHMDFLLGRPLEEVTGGLGYAIRSAPKKGIAVTRKGRSNGPSPAFEDAREAVYAIHKPGFL